jgi:SAM-dependent methyltransferase
MSSNMHRFRPALRVRESAFKLFNSGKQRFECPICHYVGPFRDLAVKTGHRMHARCARCGALERHRLQSLVVHKVFDDLDTSSLRMLHFAPEDFFRPIFTRMFGSYETADLDGVDVDHRADLQALPFADGSYDVVYASHVLEHVPDDASAIAEIRRILAPGGIAILPVPLVAPTTIDYPQPNPNETMHVRAPGPDYFDRYAAHFARVERHGSDDFPERYQLYTYEDRSRLPNEQLPLRLPMSGVRHADIVPVCYA